MKIFTRIISLFLSIAVYLSCVSANASAVFVPQVFDANISPVVQAKSLWCWAACAEMCGKSICRSSTRTQYDVVKYVKGNLNNVSGNTVDGIKGCKYVSNNTKEFYAGMLSAKQVFNHLLLREGVIAIQWIKNNSIKHGVVISQVQWLIDLNDSKSYYYINYIDPANGELYHCSFQDFCNGTYNSREVKLMLYAE